MNDFEMNAINQQHITELQAESQNMALARSLREEPAKKVSSGGFGRPVGTAFGKAARAMHIPSGASKQQPA